MSARSAVVALCCVLAACATRPQTPARVIPSGLGALPAAKPGEGVLVVDVTDGPSEVETANGAARCTTPCALALSLGTQTLLLRYRDVQGRRTVDRTRPLVLEEPQVLRRTLERTVILHPVRHHFALASYLLANAALLAAVLVACSGAHDHHAGRAASWGLAGAGGGMLGLSFTLLIGTKEDSKGAQVQFPLAHPD